MTHGLAGTAGRDLGQDATFLPTPNATYDSTFVYLTAEGPGEKLILDLTAID